MSREGGSYVLNDEGKPELVERTGWKPPKPASEPKKASTKPTKRGAKK